MPAAPAPTTTTDSPSAMMTTSPWRSTKCSAAITNPSVLVNQGVTQSRTARGPEELLRAPPGDPSDEHEPRRRAG